MKRGGYILLNLLFVAHLYAQHKKDTSIWIKNITINTYLVNNENISSMKSHIDHEILEINITKNLADILSENSVLYVKSMGQGGVSLASFRGTSSNHTQVDWNGININTTTFGNFDFSLIPALFTDEISFIHGNNYLQNGSGALGGVVQLHNDPFDTSFYIKTLAEYGSNNTYTGGVVFNFHRNNFYSKTRIIYQHSDNNFRYLNKLLLHTPFYERRKNADYTLAGAMQELYWKLKNDFLLSTNIWYSYNDRNLPQPIIVVNQFNQHTQNNSLRTFIALEKDKKSYQLKSVLAYVYDNFFYKQWWDGDFPYLTKQYNQIQSFIAKQNFMYRFSNLFHLNTHFNYTFSNIKSINYSGKYIVQNDISLQSSALYFINNRIQINAQIMGQLVNTSFLPTFTAGVNCSVVKNLLNLKSTIGYNYHYPTLNDRYWTPGGNPNLLPEKGLSYDITLNMKKDFLKYFSFKTDISSYIMDIKNWIVWLPTSTYIWTPQNLKSVLSYGAEFVGEIAYRRKKISTRFIFNYAYSPSIYNAKKFANDRSYRKQVPYIPLQKWNVRYILNWYGFELSYSMIFIDVRYTSTDNDYFTPKYIIHNLYLQYDIPLARKHLLSVKFRVENLWNSYYESTQYYPMPLRTMYGSVTWKW